ncbi:MAG: hypothetical protein ACK583_14880 [Cyanobacteriota bacterium]|jgi:hypothetical protein
MLQRWAPMGPDATSIKVARHMQRKAGYGGGEASCTCLATSIKPAFGF